MVYTLRLFSSKCSLFHNSNVFGSCIIQILYPGCVKIKILIRKYEIFQQKEKFLYKLVNETIVIKSLYANLQLIIS
jgi:hypothetical protein